MEGWKKTLLCLGGAAGAAAVLYYLLREEEGSAPASDLGDSGDSKKTKTRVEDVTKDMVQQILNEIIESQEKMKTRMKEITQELLSKPLSVMETYKRIAEVQPDEVLDKYAISMQDFDQLLNKHQNDPHIRMGIQKIMGMPDPAAPNPSADKVSAKKVVEAHTYMLEELNKVLADINKLPNRATLDPKAIVQAAQAIVAARLEQKFSITQEDMEAAMMKHQQILATDQEFAAVSMKMQATMGQLMGADA